MIVASSGQIAPVSGHDHETPGGCGGCGGCGGYVPGRVLHLVTDALPTTSAGYTIRTHEIALAQRAAAIESNVRCPECKDVSVAQSEESTALAVRHQIERQLAAGRTAAQIEQTLVSQYGPTILLEPDGFPLIWLLSSATSVFATITSGAQDAQGIANNTVAIIVADLVALVASFATARLFEGFERKPVARPAHRWVVVADDETGAPGSAPAVELAGEEPAA